MSSLFSKSSSSSDRRPRPGPKPGIRQDKRIEKISIYGNGLVAGGMTGGTHHVLTILETEQRFILLEVERCEHDQIHIHMANDKSESEILKRRVNKNDLAEFWDSEVVDASPSKVQDIINEYHGATYSLLSRDCRRFVDDVCEACGAKIRAKWGLF
ncbi:hypothetical protein I4U23_024528 [Adineta vaga]|nr:hypothetical protein I4U23_024528 [Adineta vaga]